MKVFMNIDVAPSDNIMTEKEGNLLRLYFDFQKEEVHDMDGNIDNSVSQYSCQNVDIRGDHGYGSIVNAIMNDKYTPDQVQAIMFNHELAKDEESDITEEKRTEYLVEYQALQQYRAHAKEIASLVLIDIA